MSNPPRRRQPPVCPPVQRRSRRPAVPRMRLPAHPRSGSTPKGTSGTSYTAFDGRLMRGSAACFCFLALVACVGRARGDEKQTCVNAAESAQRQRSGGRLREARASLLVCARAACPAIVRSDCVAWLAENEASEPTVVLRAQDE